MANIRKLSTFRQLSLNCDTTLNKQFNEDRPPQPVKIAWAEPDSPIPKEETGVIVRKCIKEVKKTPKLTKHSSLDKDSILYSKQELAERLRQAFKEREREKPNLNIFLAHNTQEDETGYNNEVSEPEPRPPPKLIPPLLENTMKNVFQIRKTVLPSSKSSAVVVIPMMDPKSEPSSPRVMRSPVPTPPISDRSSTSLEKQDTQAIKNVIIRPSTAAAKRERFQKRTNTAFNSMSKEIRPPLVRSSSAPTKPEASKPKFLATKRKIKSGKRSNKLNSEDEDSLSNKENPKNKKEMNRHVHVNGNEIVTMVSLVSPAASDNEEVEVDKPKAKKEEVKVKKEEKEGGKNVSLRKTVKSVSFQQSSIHAIRSFSASFPARRGSMATALMLGNGTKNQKNQEKRGTNSAVSDDDERGPKRRLVRSATDKTQKSEEDEAALKIDTKISVDIKTKEEQQIPQDSVTNTTEEEKPQIQITDDVVTEDEPSRFGSVKEKQCWDMYCKMADKGLKVSYDTILRGMLTPTEYRMRRRESSVGNLTQDVINAQN